MQFWPSYFIIDRKGKSEYLLFARADDNTAKLKAPTKVVVSEAGASVYSASELAAREFPDLDVSLRGAVSIARRLQDPLAIAALGRG